MDKKRWSEKERLEVTTPHADECAVSRYKKRESCMSKPDKTTIETCKVVVIDYCATGEGRHVYIKTGPEESVKREVGDWLYQRADVYAVEQWLALDKERGSTQYQTSNIETLKRFAPVLWEAMKEGVPMLVNVEFHWNRS